MSSKISKFKVPHDVVHPSGQVPGTHVLRYTSSSGQGTTASETALVPGGDIPVPSLSWPNILKVTCYNMPAHRGWEGQWDLLCRAFWWLMDSCEAPMKDKSKSQKSLLTPRWDGWVLLYQHSHQHTQNAVSGERLCCGKSNPLHLAGVQKDERHHPLTVNNQRGQTVLSYFGLRD